MRLIEINRKLTIIFIILLIGLIIDLLRKADLNAKQDALFKTKIATLNKDLLEFKPWVTSRKYENFIEGKKIPPSILKNPVYKNYFSENPNTLSIILVGTSVDCGSCTEEEIKIWNNFFSQETSHNIKKFSIYHSNSKENLKNFKKKYQNVFPVLGDTSFSFMRALEIQRTPVILFLNNNKIIYAHIPISGDKEKTEDFIRKIKRSLL